MAIESPKVPQPPKHKASWVSPRFPELGGVSPWVPYGPMMSHGSPGHLHGTAMAYPGLYSGTDVVVHRNGGAYPGVHLVWPGSGAA